MFACLSDQPNAEYSSLDSMFDIIEARRTSYSPLLKGIALEYNLANDKFASISTPDSERGVDVQSHNIVVTANHRIDKNTSN